MFLLAISGGPDSMFMLNDQLKKHSNKNIIVAFVNYHQRDDSFIDQEIVTYFCEINNIKLEILELKKEDYKKSNFQDWARIERYNFFHKVYLENNCEKLLIAQHKDDYLETALMQIKKGKIVNYYGIKEKSFLFGMNVERPYLFAYFKDELEKINIKNNIKYAIDYTNNLDKYQRNIVRHLLQKKSKLWKNLMIIKFRLKNFILSIKQKQQEKKYKFWENKEFNQDVFKKMKNKEDLVYRYINDKFHNISLTKQKILSIVDFILSKKRTSKYLLKDNIFLEKEHGKLKDNV